MTALSAVRSAALLAMLLTLSVSVLAAPSVRAVHPASGSGGILLAAHPSRGFAPLLVTYNLTLPNGSRPSLLWEFGDGTVWNASTTGDLAPTHRFTAVGLYRTTIVATWPWGQLNASVPIVVLSSNLTVGIARSPANGSAPLTVTFSAEPAGGSGTYTDFVWSFGDGGRGIGESVRYTYANAGDYRANVTVTDSAGRSANASASVAVATGGGSSGAGSGSPSLTTRLFALLPLLALLIGLVGLVSTAAWAASSRRRRPTTGAPPVGAMAAGRGPEPATTSAPPGAPPGPSGPAARLPPTAVPRSSPPTSDFAIQQRLTNAVLTHLAREGRLGGQDVPTPARTQEGIGRALGASQSAVSKVLRRLDAAGFVRSASAHVLGGSRRVRVYELTERGERLSRALRSIPERPAIPGALQPPPALENRRPGSGAGAN